MTFVLFSLFVLGVLLVFFMFLFLFLHRNLIIRDPSPLRHCTSVVIVWELCVVHLVDVIVFVVVVFVVVVVDGVLLVVDDVIVAVSCLMILVD